MNLSRRRPRFRTIWSRSDSRSVPRHSSSVHQCTDDLWKGHNRSILSRQKRDTGKSCDKRKRGPCAIARDVAPGAGKSFIKSAHKYIVLFSGAVLLVALGVTASLWTFRQIQEAAAVRKHTYAVINGANDFLSALKDAETSARDYLLRGDEADLKLYLVEHDSTRRRLKEVRQLTLLSAAQKDLDTMTPLVDAILAELSHVIELRRNHDLNGALAIERNGEGRRLMHSIRAEMHGFMTLEEGLLVQREAELQASLRNLLVLMVVTSLLALLVAFALAYLIHRETEQRLKNLVLLGTQRSLEIQQETSTKLRQANASLRDREEELVVKNQELESAKFEAEKANLAKSEFLAGMSHELRTPLNAVLGFAQLMEAGIPPPSTAQKPKIDQILKAGWHLLGLINEILDLAKIESGKVTVSHEPMSLTKVLKDCQAMIDPQAHQRDIQVAFLGLDNSFHVLGDKTAVTQVMVNLLSNAIKYNRVGGTVMVQCALSGENRLRVSVKDSGAGLSPELLAQLFQPFNRLGQESGPEEGTGIGLVITKQLVELMGGVIGAESVVGVGSTFWFELALSSAPQPVSGSISKFRPDEQDHGSAHELLAQRTVLYVEDNPANLALVEELILRRSNLKLLKAMDGRHGIQLARTCQPDVILMDMQLPGINGLGVLQVLREDPATARIPVMALSADALPQNIEKAMAAGFFRYLTKPIKVIEFMDALDAALRCAVERARSH